ncbi:MAG: hypothetical protein OWQ48_04380 [Desulfurococcus sp.]|nr:hypothetical protein [Desulfurococcus sp.]
MSSRVVFAGVVVSVESLEGFEQPLLYLHGRVDGVEEDFYVLVDEGRIEEYLRLGIGQSIEGIGVKVSEKPLVLKLVEG